MTVHYDDLSINRDIRLDLPFREGVGTITQDVAKLHHPVSLINTPAWTKLDSFLGCLSFNGTNEYLQSPAADTTLLDFTSGDYSIGGWLFITAGGDDDKTLMSRFKVSTDGWEIYHYAPTLTLQMRHHHGSNAPGDIRSSAYSHGWAFNTWYFMCFTRILGHSPGYLIHIKSGIIANCLNYYRCDMPRLCSKGI